MITEALRTLTSLVDLSSKHCAASVLCLLGLGTVVDHCIRRSDSWEVRDGALRLLSSLALKEGADLKHLVDMAVGCVRDEETYVRAAALEALKILWGDECVWTSLSHSGLVGPLQTQLPWSVVLEALKDSDAFVKRSALDCFINVIMDKHSQNLVYSSISNSKDIQSALIHLLKATSNDPDWEVRTRLVTLLRCLMIHGIAHGDVSTFVALSADSLLVNSVRDSNRLVRQEAACALETIFGRFDTCRDSVPPPLQPLVLACDRLDFKQIKREAEADELYETLLDGDLNAVSSHDLDCD